MSYKQQSFVPGGVFQEIYVKQLKQSSEWNSNKYLREFNIQPALEKLAVKRGRPPTTAEIAESVTQAYKMQFGPDFLNDSAAASALKGAIELGIYVTALTIAMFLALGCVGPGGDVTVKDISVDDDAIKNTKMEKPVYDNNTGNALNQSAKDSKITPTPAMSEKKSIAVSDKLPFNPDDFQEHYDVVRSSYIEDVFIGSHDGKLVVGAKVKPETPGESVVAFEVIGGLKGRYFEGGRNQNKIEVNIQLYDTPVTFENRTKLFFINPNAYSRGILLNDANVTYYHPPGWRVAVFDSDLLKADGISLGARDDKGSVLKSGRLLVDLKRI